MQLSPRRESLTSGDQSWIASKHGTDSARTFTIDVTASAGKISQGRIRSGEPFAIVGGLGVPYNAAGSAGTNVLAVFLLTDQPVTAGAGNVVAAGLDHGRIRVSRLPSPVAADATTTGQFIFV
ncbi:potassium transporter [Nocardia brasiliensis]|uniref:potassium transporter n=1 Tax=Nocardia brasiliensis TaxID=37326 RepID=UPI0024554DE4|nr:potassium transporter [Nocardia brasiliensis]